MLNQQPSTMRPVVGDIVHFVYNQRDWAAIVTAVWSDSVDSRVNLYVFPDASHNFGSSQIVAMVPYNNAERNHVNATRRDNSWHWPEQPESDGDLPVPELSEING